MFKPFCIVLLFFLSSSTYVGQVEIKASDFAPEIGWKYVLHSIEYLDSGEDGLAAVWDMSDAQITHSNAVRIIAPEESPFGEFFPTSNICFDFGGSNYMYASHSETVYRRDGGVANGTAVPLTDPQTILRFPLHYGQSHTDAFSSNFTIENIPFKREGVIVQSTVGQGTLILPFGVIDKVLKLRITETIHDHYQVNGKPAQLDVINTSYLFLKGGTNEVILTLTQSKSNGELVKSYGTLLDRSSAKTALASEAPIRALTVESDYLAQNLNIQFVSEWEGELSLLLKDIRGKATKSSKRLKVSPGPYEIELSMADLPAATYLLQVELDGRKSLLRVVKEK